MFSRYFLTIVSFTKTVYIPRLLLPPVSPPIVPLADAVVFAIVALELLGVGPILVVLFVLVIVDETMAPFDPVTETVVRLVVVVLLVIVVTLLVVIAAVVVLKVAASTTLGTTVETSTMKSAKQYTAISICNKEQSCSDHKDNCIDLVFYTRARNTTLHSVEPPGYITCIQ